MKVRTGESELQKELDGISYEISKIETDYNKYLNILTGCVNSMRGNFKGLYAIYLGKIKLKKSSHEIEEKWEDFQHQTFEVYNQLEAIYQETHDTKMMSEELRDRIDQWKRDQENLENKKNPSELDKTKLKAINEFVISLQNYLAVFNWKAVLEKRREEFANELKRVEKNLYNVAKFDAKYLQVKKLLADEQREDAGILISKNYKVTDTDLNVQRVVAMHKKVNQLKSDIDQHNDAVKSINLPSLPVEIVIAKAEDNIQLSELKALVESSEKQYKKLNDYIQQLEGMSANVAKHDKNAQELESRRQAYHAEKEKMIDDMHKEFQSVVEKKRSVAYDNHFNELDGLKINKERLALPNLTFPAIFEGSLTTNENDSIKVPLNIERRVQKINEKLNQHENKNKKSIKDLKEDYNKTQKKLLENVHHDVAMHLKKTLAIYHGYDPDAIGVEKLGKVQYKSPELWEKLQMAKESCMKLEEHHQSNTNLKSVKENILQNQNNQKVKSGIVKIMQAKKIKNVEELFNYEHMEKLKPALKRQLQRAFRNELNQALVIMHLSEVGASIPDKSFVQQYKMIKRRFDDLAHIAVMYADYKNYLDKSKHELNAKQVNILQKKNQLTADIMNKIRKTGHSREGTLMTYTSNDILSELAVLHADKRNFDIASKNADTRGKKIFTTCANNLLLFAPPIMTGHWQQGANGKHGIKLVYAKLKMRKKQHEKLRPSHAHAVRATHKRRARASHSH